METQEKRVPDLAVIVKARELTAYVVDATEKSPRQFRVAFSNRLQNYALDALENLVAANFTKLANLQTRKSRQEAAFVKLKVLQYTSYTAWRAGAIKETQFEVISKMVEEISQLLAAWMKSDETRADPKKI
jgi:hypothetical protein